MDDMSADAFAAVAASVTARSSNASAFPMEGGLLVVCTGSAIVDLEKAAWPPDALLELKATASQVEVRAKPARLPSKLVVSVWPEAPRRNLVFPPVVFPSVTVRFHPDLAESEPGAIANFSSLAADTLTTEGPGHVVGRDLHGECKLELNGTNRRPAGTAGLDGNSAATLFAGSRGKPSLLAKGGDVVLLTVDIRGDCAIGGVVRCKTLNLRSDASLQVSGRLTATALAVHPTDDRPPWAHISGDLVIDSLSGNLNIFRATLTCARVQDAELRSLGPEPNIVTITEHASDLSVHGPSLSLDVGKRAEVERLHGTEFSLSAREGAIVHGYPDGGCRPGHVEAVSGAHLRDLDVLGLHGVTDPVRLREAASLTIRYPTTRKRASREEREIRIDEGRPSRQSRSSIPDHIRTHRDRENLALFLADLAETVTILASPGDLQSRVRYAAARARRIAGRPFTREHTVLTLYSWVGYGERVAQPIGLFALICVGATVLADQLWSAPFGSVDTLAELWGTFATAPLAFFRFGRDVTATSIGPQLLLSGVGASGVVLLFFSLSAVRRTALPKRRSS